MIWKKKHTFFHFTEAQKVVKWQKLKTALYEFTKKVLSSNVVRTEIRQKSSNHFWGQSHGWILFFYYIRSSFFVRLQSSVFNICHHHLIGSIDKETDFSVKSSWEVHWILKSQKDDLLQSDANLTDFFLEFWCEVFPPLHVFL